MNLHFEDEQHEFRHSVRGVLQRAMAGDVAPDDLTGEPTRLNPPWAHVATTGWLELIDHTGASPGGTSLDLLALHIELGRQLAVGPYVPVELARSLLAAAGGGDLLGRSTSGDAVLVPLGIVGGAVVSRSDGGAIVIDGSAPLTAYAPAASHIVIVLDGAEGEDLRLAVVDVGRPGVRVDPHLNVAELPLGSVELQGVRLRPDDVVGPITPASIEHARRLFALMHTGAIIGMGERLLELSTEYASQRRQFGQPIGVFQAVQYLCTDIALHVHQTLLLAIAAARALDGAAPAGGRVGVAAVSAADAAARVAVCAHEVFAGAAFMMDSDVQRFSRRLKHVELELRRWDAVSDVLDAPAASNGGGR